MSDGFMADPIRPGDMNSGQSPTTNGRFNDNRNNNSSGKLVILIFLLIFILPILFFGYIFIKIWNEAGDDIIAQIREEAQNGRNYGSYYELSNNEQMAAARIFGTGMLYNNGGPKTIAQRDCKHLKNAVTSYFNQINAGAQWYDNTYCAAGTVNLSTYFTDETEQNIGGPYARIDISSTDTQSCMNIAFTDNFRYIMAAQKLGKCTANTIEIRADDTDIPEVKPDREGEPTDDEEEPDVPAERAKQVLRS
ncbi:hypothetical protein J6X15_03205 [Candidatus Saccharibacteria bacterium]|nr:hypothetical protein [Candidatus Saccharibacteria bacterium]